MEILEIKDIDVDELKVCTQWLKFLKKLEEISKICNLIFLNLFTFTPVFTNDKN
jgi:hypothetical protein